MTGIDRGRAACYQKSKGELGQAHFRGGVDGCLTAHAGEGSAFWSFFQQEKPPVAGLAESTLTRSEGSV